ncbi:MAG: metallopeptidase TldD-related protein [Bryobacteraceae bacterium]|nr:metallopeptidase TldD-related protein [Bryobacteraceae bacterium]
MFPKVPALSVICLLLATAVGASGAGQSALLEILADELKRNFEALKKADPAPYYLAYEVTEEDAEAVAATFGSLQSANSNRSRNLDVTIRVGSPKLDNYHRMQGDFAQFTAGIAIPLEDNAAAIKRRIWLETDRVYRLASQRLIRLKTNTQVKAAEEDTSDDFSLEEPSDFVQSAGKLAFNRNEWSAKVRKWSAEFSKHRGVLSSSVTALASQQMRYIVNTEGTRIQHGRGFARILIGAFGKAGDGMDLSATDSFEAESPDRLPKDEQVAAAVETVGKRLTDLLRAPPVDPYVGPAILSGSSAGVFFHEIFGHRIEGHRQKDEAEGQTFTKSVDKGVLPEFLSVVFDPTRKNMASTDLNGWYAFDDEGVKARPVKVVEDGILRTFLMSRSPVRGFPKSNGHGRRQPGAEVVSRQSNLIVESKKMVPEEKLRAMLVEETKKQGKPYGLYFQQVTGGFTTTGRRGLQAFTVIPLVVYRVYPDGRPDELVRGVNIVGTPLASFAKIIATSDRHEVFNGICGAESGSVPVSAVSPALLVSEIEIQRKAAGIDSPPTLPRPTGAGGGQ